VAGKILACVPLHKSAEPNCVVVRIDLNRRAALIKAHPDVYYVTDHYAAHPAVLVRLSCISAKELSELLELAWRFVSTKKATRSTGAKLKRSAMGPKRQRD
jgi:hypothetical protein